VKRLRYQTDEGFTLVEVMIALVIFGIAAAATTPLLLKSIEASVTGKLNTQAKNLLQLRIESMRNLPFHVATSAGPYIDLLDTYFRDGTGTPANTACDTHAYSTTTSTYTCSRTGAKLALPGFSEQVDAQFVDHANAVVVPPSGYDSQGSTTDVPPSNTLSVVVTETWLRAGQTKTFSATTQISSAATGLPEVVSRIRDSAVSVYTATDDLAVPTTLQFDAGLLNASAGLSTGATANAQAQGALATLSTGEVSTGQALGYLDAPPDQTSFAPATGSASTGVPCASLFSCFGVSSVAGVTGTANNGLPRVGSVSAPLSSSLTRSDLIGAKGFWLSNVPTGTTQSVLVRLGVQAALTPPTSDSPTQLVRTVQTASNAGYVAGCTGAGAATSNADFATSTGYVATSGGATHSVTTCATATTRRLDLFPLAGATGFAGDGVVQVVLQYAGVQCVASAGTGTATATFHGTVSFLPYGASQPTVLTIDSGQASDPLTPALLTKSVATGGVQVGVDRNGSPLWLGDYLKSWSSGSLSRTQPSGSAQADLKAVVISTIPTRDADSTGASSINLVAGQLSCLSQDNR